MNEQEKYIIDSPAIKSFLRNGTELTITFIAWFLWFYLLMPLVTFVMWALGIRLFFVKQVMLDGIEGLLSVVFYYFAGILAIGSILTLWSLYNNSMYGGYDRRQQSEPVTSEELSRLFSIPQDQIKSAADARNISVGFAENKVSISIIK